MTFNFRFSTLYHLSSGIINYKDQSRALVMLGKLSTHWATSPAPTERFDYKDLWRACGNYSSSKCKSIGEKETTLVPRRRKWTNSEEWTEKLAKPNDVGFISGRLVQEQNWPLRSFSDLHKSHTCMGANARVPMYVNNKGRFLTIKMSCPGFN